MISLFEIDLFGWLFSCCHRQRRDTAYPCIAHDPSSDCQPIQSQPVSTATTVGSTECGIPVRDMFPRVVRPSKRGPITADNLHARAAELNLMNSVYRIRKTNSRRATQSYVDTCIGMTSNNNPVFHHCDHNSLQVYGSIASRVRQSGVNRISQDLIVSAFRGGKSEASPSEDVDSMVCTAKEIDMLKPTGPLEPDSFSVKERHLDGNVFVISDDADSDPEDGAEHLSTNVQSCANTTHRSMVDSSLKANICHKEEFYDQSKATTEGFEEVKSVVSADSFVSINLSMPPSGDFD